MLKQRLDTLRNPKSKPDELIQVAHDIQADLDRCQEQLRSVLLAYRGDMMREMRGGFDGDAFNEMIDKVMAKAVEVRI
jgi:Glu-tRNA(Gln) amidotransferase subunit E-like FAD-binding protein